MKQTTKEIARTTAIEELKQEAIEWQYNTTKCDDIAKLSEKAQYFEAQCNNNNYLNLRNEFIENGIISGEKIEDVQEEIKKRIKEYLLDNNDCSASANYTLNLLRNICFSGETCNQEFWDKFNIYEDINQLRELAKSDDKVMNMLIYGKINKDDEYIRDNCQYVGRMFESISAHNLCHEIKEDIDEIVEQIIEDYEQIKEIIKDDETLFDLMYEYHYN